MDQIKEGTAKGAVNKTPEKAPENKPITISGIKYASIEEVKATCSKVEARLIKSTRNGQDSYYVRFDVGNNYHLDFRTSADFYQLVSVLANRGYVPADGFRVSCFLRIVKTRFPESGGSQSRVDAYIHDLARLSFVLDGDKLNLMDALIKSEIVSIKVIERDALPKETAMVVDQGE